jgi:sulfur carrier protein ThiS
LKLHLGGHLSFYEPRRRAWVELALATPQRLDDLLADLRIPVTEVALVVINGMLAQEDKPLISNDDQVELYPPMGGGQAFLQELS